MERAQSAILKCISAKNEAALKMLKGIGIRHCDEIDRYTVVPVQAPYYAVAFYDLRESPVYYVKALVRVRLPSTQQNPRREGFGISVFVGRGYSPGDYTQVSELEAGSASAVESQISKALALAKQLQLRERPQDFLRKDPGVLLRASA